MPDVTDFKTNFFGPPDVTDLKEFTRKFYERKGEFAHSVGSG